MSTPEPDPRHRRHTRRSAGVVRLAWRQFAYDKWVSLLLALMVALVSLVATLWPRFVEDMNTRQVPYLINNLSVIQRDVIAVYTSTVGVGPEAEPPESVKRTWGPRITGLEDIQEAQPEPLRTLMGPPQFYVDVGDPVSAGGMEGTDIAQVDITTRVDPFLADHVRLVQGSWPELVINASFIDARPGAVPEPTTTTPQPVQVVIADSAAKRLGWTVGQPGLPVLVTGTFEPTDPDDTRWEHSPNGDQMNVLFDGDIGNIGKLAAYLPAANPGTTGLPVVNRMHAWFPLDAAAVRADQVSDLAIQLEGLASGAQPLWPKDGPTLQPGDIDATTVPQAIFSSEAVDTFRALASGQRATARILAVVAAGPVGVLLAAFALAARLIVARRSTALALASARGGSEAQVRGVLLTEGLVVGLPAAALGYAAAGLVVPRSTGWWELVIAALIGALPGLALVFSGGQRSLRKARSDLGSKARTRWRWIGEIIVIALAAIAVWRLLGSGLGPADTADTATGPSGEGVAVQASTGVDLLLAATPILLALAACVITLRIYPIPAQALIAAFRNRAGLTSFLGAARSVRDTAGGLLPALAVILGVGVAVSSAVMASTITQGGEAAAWDSNGAQLRLSGPRLTPQLQETITGIAGIDQVAKASLAEDSAQLTGDITANVVAVYVIDSSMQQVQQVAPLADPFPAALFAPPPGPAPILTGGDVQATSGTAQLAGFGPVTVVGHIDSLAWMRTDPSFVIIDAARWAAAGKDPGLATVALMSVKDPAALSSVAASLQEAVSGALDRTVSSSVVAIPEDRLAEFRSAPVTVGLVQFFVAAVVLTTLLTVLAIVIVQLIGAPARVRVLAVLRTLGLGRRQGRALTVWELTPLVTMAFLVGAVIGLLIPWLLLRAVDLSGLTGGQSQPVLALDPLVLGPVLLGILVTVALAIAISAAVAARADLAQQLRIGEER